MRSASFMRNWSGGGSPRISRGRIAQPIGMEDFSVSHGVPVQKTVVGISRLHD